MNMFLASDSEKNNAYKLVSSAVLENGNISKDFFSVLQNNISKRFEKQYRKDTPVTYEVTNDRALLHQYYILRERMYKIKHKKMDLDGYELGEDLYDKLGVVIIARKGNLCLGGVRLIIREGDESWDLPMECDDFKIRNLFPDLKLNSERHAEISRFAVVEDTGGEDIFLGLCKALYNQVIASDIHYLFVKSTYQLARSWRLIANNFGAKNTKIISDVHPVDKTLADDIKWYLVMSDISNLLNSGTNAKQVSNQYSKEISEELN